MLLKLDELLAEAGQVLLGKEHAMKLALTAMVCNGHLLIEDVPGVGKTTLVYLLSRLLGIPISRIQFTNDLLPSDIIGLNIYDKETGEFRFIRGPIFGQIILADELNRASPKTQSALLQAMEERQVSLDGQDYNLAEPFLVVATQNPGHQVGTFPLPESQLDRFFMSLKLGFPNREDERQILRLTPHGSDKNELNANRGPDFLKKVQEEVQSVHVAEDVVSYILDLLEYGRANLEHGVALSPRSGQDVLLAAKGWAYLHGKDFVTADDVQKILEAVWSHRLGGQRGRRFGVNDVEKILKNTPVDA